jgi:hypothetical protein
MVKKVKVMGVLLVITIISMCITGCTGENPQLPEGNQTVENPEQPVSLIPTLTNLELCNVYNCTAGSTRDVCIRYC